MGSSNNNFFESPQAAAIYKHGLLRRYLPVFAGKTGSTAPDRRVVVYDAYSGPGRYEDDEPGSPALLVETADALAGLRAVHAVFSEKNSKHREQLAKMLSDAGIDPETYVIREGTAEEEVDWVLAHADKAPLFVFLDPFGLAVPFTSIVRILNARKNPRLSRYQQPKTEVLLNFSYEALRRLVGAFLSEKEYASKSAQIARLNEALGGTWWHDLAKEQKEGWEREIRSGFARRIHGATDCGYITAMVSDRRDIEPVYDLILFTRHNDGVWKMAESMSHARQEWSEWLGERSMHHQLLLMPDFEDDSEAWIEEIASNIETLLAEGSGFVVGKALGDVLGRTLGLAREKHIREALRRVKAKGLIAQVPKGTLQKAHIARS